jgi:hypothetical protein
LKELGVSALGHRRLLLRAIAPLDNVEKRISIHGMITVNYDQRFHDAVQAIDETKTVLVKLDRPGGLIFPGIEMQRRLNAVDWGLPCPRGDRCATRPLLSRVFSRCRSPLAES